MIDRRTIDGDVVAYAWRVTTKNRVKAEQTSCGITDVGPAADRWVIQALKRLPNSEAQIRHVSVNLLYSPESYTYGSVLATAHWDGLGRLVAKVAPGLEEVFPELAARVPPKWDIGSELRDRQIGGPGDEWSKDGSLT